MILKVDNLVKKYGAVTAVNNLSLEVHKGQVFGILGPNGSGKTTTLGVVMGVIKSDSGSFSWFGENQPQKARGQIGTLLETPNFYPYMNAVDNLKVVAHIKKTAQPKIDELLEMVNLKDRKKSKFTTYSLGMKQRLAIAAAMISDPEVLVLDEPTNGLDPEGIVEVRNLILQIAKKGKTIILASHMLDEVEKICSHVAIIKKGALLSVGGVGAIINKQQTVEIGTEDQTQLNALLEKCTFIHSFSPTKLGYELVLKDEFSAADLNKYFFDNHLVLTHLLVKNRSLEQEFLEITQ